MRNLRKYYLQKKGMLFLVVFLKILNAINTVGYSVLLYIIIGCVTDGIELEKFLYVGLFSLLYLLYGCGISFVCRSITEVYVIEMTASYRQDIAESIIGLSFPEFNKRTAGEYVTMVQKDVETISSGHFRMVFDIIECLVSLIVAIAFAFYLNWIVALILIALSILVILSSNLFIKRISKETNEASNVALELSKAIENSIDGAFIAKNCGALHRLAELIREKNKRLEKVLNRKAYFVFANYQIVGFFVTAIEIGSVFIASLFVVEGKSNIAMVVTFIQLSSTIYNPMYTFITNITTMRSTKEIIAKLASLGLTNQYKEEASQMDVDKIELKNLTMSVPSKILFNDVSYAFEKNKKYIIVGESGSGKSTLLDSLMGRKKEYKGEILIGDEDISAMSEGKTDSIISYCRQEPFLFIGSLVENVTVYDKTPDMEKVYKVISICKLDAFAELRGLDTPLDNGQSAISLGEMQRISLARALYLDKPILLLDEVTSSLDPENAKDVMEAIKEINDRLVIWVCHQKGIEKMGIGDVVLSLQNQKLVEI